MELSEAKEILEDVKGIYIEAAECGLSSGSVSKAILTILQELDRLQKENEKYIIGELMTRNQAKHFEEINNKYYIHKDKIREKIEKLNEIADEDNMDEFIKISILQDLLKEE